MSCCIVFIGDNKEGLQRMAAKVRATVREKHTSLQMATCHNMSFDDSSCVYTYTVEQYLNPQTSNFVTLLTYTSSMCDDKNITDELLTHITACYTYLNLFHSINAINTVIYAPTESTLNKLTTSLTQQYKLWLINKLLLSLVLPESVPESDPRVSTFRARKVLGPDVHKDVYKKVISCKHNIDYLTWITWVRTIDSCKF